jgi:hypothetical protein
LKSLDDIILVPPMLEPMANADPPCHKPGIEQNMAIHHFYHKNVEQALIHTRNILLLYDQKAGSSRGEMQYIFTTYYNYSLDLIMLHRYEEAAEMIEAFE